MKKNTKLEKIQLNSREELHDLLTPSKEIRICKGEKGYWLFDDQWIKKTNLTEYSPTSEWVKEIKPLKKGENTFEGDFPNGYYLLKVKIDDQELQVSFTRGNWRGLINAETYKLNRNQKHGKGEKWVIITPQVFEYLKDFGLIKA